MKAVNSLNKIIKNSATLSVISMIAWAVYEWLNTEFAKIFGTALDVAAAGMPEFKKFAVQSVSMLALVIIFAILSKSFKNKRNKKIFTDIRTKLFDAIQNKSICEFNKEGQDVYSSVLINDIKMIEEKYVNGIFAVIEDIISIIIVTTALVMINPICAIIVMAASCIQVFVPNLFMGKLQEKLGKYAGTNQEFLQSVNESMDGVETYKNYNAVQEVKKKFIEQNRQITQAKQSAFMYLGILMNGLAVVSNAILVAILLCGMFMVFAGTITIGEMFALMYISGIICDPIESIAKNIPNIKGIKEIVDKYNRILENTKDNGNKVTLQDKISLQNYSLNINDRQILDNINIELKKGQKYAFVGGSGSGKSTIIKSIIGYFDDYKGDICYDGRSISDINTNSVFDNVTYVSQTPVMFTGTLRDNITMFNNKYSNKEVMEVISKACLDKKILELQKGLDTLVNEGGKNFSGGEKQRIAIARALLRGKNIFIMDEATSALDYENYIKIENMLLNIPNVTLITVTHRMNESILLQYDKIFAINNGVVAEEGSFYNLIKKEGYFAKLYSSQQIADEQDENVEVAVSIG